MPGVSMYTIWASGRFTIPRIRLRVVCAADVTIETFEPTSAFNSVLLPAFGRPTIATKPDLKWDSSITDVLKVRQAAHLTCGSKLAFPFQVRPKAASTSD